MDRHSRKPDQRMTAPDNLDEESREALHRALVQSEHDVKDGRLVDAVDVLRELRQR